MRLQLLFNGPFLAYLAHSGSSSAKEGCTDTDAYQKIPESLYLREMDFYAESFVVDLVCCHAYFNGANSSTKLQDIVFAFQWCQ